MVEPPMVEPPIVTSTAPLLVKVTSKPNLKNSSNTFLEILEVKPVGESTANNS